MSPRGMLSDYWHTFQQELFPRLESETGPMGERYELFVKASMPKTVDQNRLVNMTPDEIAMKYKVALSTMAFAEIEEKVGEEVAIHAGITADPDTREFAPEEIRRMRPASEVAPHIVGAHRRGRGEQKAPTGEWITIRLDTGRGR